MIVSEAHAQGSGEHGRRFSTVLISTLQVADSPRLAGEDQRHVRLLAESDGTLPPILVHAATMRVIDGMHRLRAAQVNGRQAMDVLFFDGTDEDAFVLSVRANIAHGLPLSRADREAAVARILSSDASRSDRWVASVVGLSAGTVAAIRRRLYLDGGQTVRIGRDGKVRPLDSSAGRAIARTALIENPKASLREIAKVAGISPTTVRDVRNKLRNIDNPVFGRQRTQSTADKNGEVRLYPSSMELRDREVLLRQLQRDPSIRFSEAGRALLRWLHVSSRGPGNWKAVVDGVPPHTLYLVAEVASRCAREWAEVADYLQAQVHQMAPPDVRSRPSGRRPR